MTFRVKGLGFIYEPLETPNPKITYMIPIEMNPKKEHLKGLRFLAFVLMVPSCQYSNYSKCFRACANDCTCALGARSSHQDFEVQRVAEIATKYHK